MIPSRRGQCRASTVPMVFGSLFFLFVYLPPVLLGHSALLALARRWRFATAAANLWLLAASLTACVLSDLPGLPAFLGCAIATDLLARGIAAAGTRRPRLRRKGILQRLSRSI